MREALERGFSFAVGIVAMLALRPHALAPTAPTVVTQRVPIAIPLAIPRTEPVLVPEIVAAVGPAPLIECPTPARADDAPIGAPVDGVDSSDTWDGARTEIAASARAPVIAIRTPAGDVSVSDDDGGTFTRAFADQRASSIAVDDRGRVYAIATDAVLVRDERGRARRTPITCDQEQCSDAVIAVGAGVAWIHDHEVRRSDDGGRHWRLLDADGSDLVGKPHRFALGGALYGTEHVEEDCGWEADQLARVVLATGASTSRTFDNDPGSPQLAIVDDGGATWRYRGGRELVLARLAPAAGGRVLFASGHQLAELCGDRARAVAFDYGADRVDAVDAAGRPLIAIGERVLRFSPRFGWRELRVSDQRVSDNEAP